MARRAFCGIKKWWVFENRNLRFLNLDFRNSKFVILKFGFSKIGNFDFRKLNFSGAFVTAKNAKAGWSFSDAFARKKVSVTDTHAHRQTHITNFGGRLHKRPFGQKCHNYFRNINFRKIEISPKLIAAAEEGGEAVRKASEGAQRGCAQSEKSEI